MRLSRVALSTTVTLALLVGCGRLRYAPSDAALGETPDTGALDAALDAALDVGPVTGDAGRDAAVGCIVRAPEAYWPMDAVDVTTSLVLDRGGRGHVGQIFGDPLPSTAPGRLGQALDFTSTTLARVESTVPFDQDQHTVSLWMRNDDPAVDQGVFCVTPTPLPEAPRYCLWLTNRLGPVSLCINGGTGDCWGVTRDDLVGRWVHVVAVFANGPTTNGRLYIDGLPVTMECRFGTCDQSRVAQGPLMLGMNEDVYAWHGLLDDVRFFRGALDDTEAAALFACTP
ncbi:MAG: LamG-like jellyroll fold domain-containing protein [Sandaracinus sp.]